MQNCVRSYLISLVFILTLSGCDLAYFADSQLLSGELKTSTGNYPITKSDKYWAIFHSSFKGSEITITPFNYRIPGSHGIVGTLGFWLPGEAENYADFKPVSAFFQINEGTKVPIKLICNVRVIKTSGNVHVVRTSGYPIYCSYPLTEILSFSKYNHPSEGMRPVTKKKIDASIKDTYRFVMMFKYNEGNESITVDFKLRLKIKTRLHFGVPGGSP